MKRIENRIGYVLVLLISLSLLAGCQQISAFSKTEQEEKKNIKEVELITEENKPTDTEIIIGESLQNIEVTETIKDPPIVPKETTGECILNEDPHILCVLPQESLQPNPRNLDTKLFAIFQNLKNQAFNRKEGIMEVYTEDTQGIMRQVLRFDVAGAFDEEGKADPDAEIEADTKITRTISNNAGYWDSNNLEFEFYWQYQEELLCLQTLFFEKGFVLSSFSGLEVMPKGDDFLITATFEPGVAESILGYQPKGTIKAGAKITKDGKLLGLILDEFTIEPEDTQKVLSHSEYSFRSISDIVD